VTNGSAALSGKHALVTGAGRGIGAAIAQALGDHGARLTLLGRNLGSLESTATRIGADSTCVAADVRNSAQVCAAFQEARKSSGDVDILVNNAGEAESAPMRDTDGELWERMLGVNLTGTYYCVREALPPMLRRGSGRIVNIASTAGLTGYAYCTAYCAAKHGVVGLTRALALEVATKGVTVNAVCPGFTDTDLLRDAVTRIQAKTGHSEREAIESLLALNPQRRLVSPVEVANAVLWLCLPGSDAINGQSIAVAGGEVT
jgi:NAD(P)-dependent dehydrogenase (short-subunit alcohol dehydrogenase family)